MSQNLLVRLKNGESVAMDELFHLYYKDLVRYALRHLAEPMVAEEIVQDLFIYLWNHRKRLIIENLESYLFRSVRNKCVSHVKSKLMQIQKSTVDESEIQVGEYHNALHVSELMELIEEGLSIVPPQTAVIFSLSRTQGLTHNEIAEELGVSRKTVEYHIGSAMKFLKGFLENHGYVLVLLAHFFTK